MTTEGGFKATYKGQVIGWYNTAKQAQAAIAKVRKAEQKEEQDWLKQRP